METFERSRSGGTIQAAKKRYKISEFMQILSPPSGIALCHFYWYVLTGKFFSPRFSISGIYVGK